MTTNGIDYEQRTTEPTAAGIPRDGTVFDVSFVFSEA